MSTTIATELTPLEWHALAIAAKAAANYRDQLQPAEEASPVDVTVRLTGDVHVGGPQNATCTEGVKLGTLLAICLGSLPPRYRQAAIEAAAERSSTFVAGGDEPELTKEEKLLAAQVAERCTRKQVVARRGSVTGHIGVHVSRRHKAA